MNILNTEPLPVPRSYSKEIKELVELLLKKDAAHRPSIDEILSLSYVKTKLAEYNMNTIHNINMNININSNNNSNRSSDSTKETISTISISTPTNSLFNNETELNFGIFNLKFDNLLSDISIQAQRNKTEYSNLENKANLIKRRHTPSLAVNEIEEIMKKFESGALDKKNRSSLFRCYIINRYLMEIHRLKNRSIVI